MSPAILHTTPSFPSSSTPTSPKDVTVRLHYLSNDPLYKTQKPLQIVPGFLDKEQRSNVRLSPGPEEVIHDIRGRESEFSLDRNGFEYVKHLSTFSAWHSQQEIGEKYLEEVEALLRGNVEGVDEIVFFDARLRHNQTFGSRGVDGLSSNPFARQVHVDQTEPTIVSKIRQLTELKADFLLKGRVRVINIWRPINHPVYDCALAVADNENLVPSDCIECDRFRRDTGNFHDTMGVVKHRPGYRWWYMSEQQPDEVVLFKGYDSDCSRGTRKGTGFCLHTAFDLPSPPPNATPRESIEVRALVFTYPDPVLLSPLRRLSLPRHRGIVFRPSYEFDATAALALPHPEGRDDHAGFDRGGEVDEASTMAMAMGQAGAVAGREEGLKREIGEKERVIDEQAAVIRALEAEVERLKADVSTLRGLMGQAGREE